MSPCYLAWRSKSRRGADIAVAARGAALRSPALGGGSLLPGKAARAVGIGLASWAIRHHGNNRAGGQKMGLVTPS